MGLLDLPPEASVAIGILVAICSTSVQSLGLTLQRKSHLLEEDRPLDLKRRPPHRRRRWQLGMGLFIVSNLLGSSVQITTLPLIILSPLQASGLVFNTLCATLILGEPFTKWSLLGTVLVCFGACLIAIFGAIKEPAHSLDELIQLFARHSFLIWGICQVFLVILILILAKLTFILGKSTEFPKRLRAIRGMAYGTISGILSAHSLLLAKSAVELLVRTIIDRVNQFNRWQSWAILIGLIVLALTQLFYLHKGLKLCSTSVLYPMVFCVYNIIAILDGIIYYEQASRLSAMAGGLIALGTCILLLGVFALSWRLNTPDTTVVNRGDVTPGEADFADASRALLEGEHAVTYGTDSRGDESPIILTSPRVSRRSPRTRRFGRTRTAKRITPVRRNITEAEEILEELEDENIEQASPLMRSSFHEDDSNENQHGSRSAESSPLLRKVRIEP